jgi:hypothetical protein
MKLSLNQAKTLQEDLRPLFDEYHTHQGWGSLESADEATSTLLAYLRKLGVNL